MNKNAGGVDGSGVQGRKEGGGKDWEGKREQKLQEEYKIDYFENKINQTIRIPKPNKER